MLQTDGLPANVLHFSELWPFPAEETLDALGNGQRSIVIEHNATGQLARLIRAETGVKAAASILKFDGRRFSPAEIVREVKREVAA